MRIREGYLQSAKAGTRPGGRPPFLCATRKEAPIRAPQPAAPAGHTCAGVLAGCAVELTARLRRSVRTTTASQWTKRACPSAHPPPRKHPAAGAARRGVGSPLRAIAALGPEVCRRYAPHKPSRAQRWPVGMFDPRVPFRICRGAQRPADQGSRLSERNAVERVRARPRWTRAPQVAWSEAQGRSL